MIAGSLAAAYFFKNRAVRATTDLPAALADLERMHGGRLGVAVLDTGNGRQADHRGNERFAMCSTHKFLTAALVLGRVDCGEERLDRRIVFNREGLVTYSPITGKHHGDSGMTVGELCAAAITLSDNTAANLLLDTLGGPAGFTARLWSFGDATTRLDRREPALNEAAPGDPRDTATPLAMLGDLREMVIGTTLSAASRRQLAEWLVDCKTGDKRLRAGIPKGWRVGDKTGSGDRNTTNDIAVIWPPGRDPIVVAAYYTQSPAGDDERDHVLATIGALATAF
jgi:beta-lactamase class A